MYVVQLYIVYSTTIERKMTEFSSTNAYAYAGLYHVTSIVFQNTKFEFYIEHTLVSWEHWWDWSEYLNCV